MAHKHKRTNPTWSPDARMVGMGRHYAGSRNSLSPEERQELRIQAEFMRRAEAALDAGQDHVDLLVLPGLAWPVW